MFRVALDLSCLEREDLTGVERYAAEIASRLEPALGGASVIGVCRAALRIQGYPLCELEIDGGAMPRAFWRRLRLPAIVRRLRADVLFCPIAHAPNVRGATVCRTIHDLPEAHPEAADEMSPLGGRARMRRILSRPQPTICVSRATYADFRRLVPSFNAPATVIHHGVAPEYFDLDRIDPAAAREAAGLPASLVPYGLVVGTFRGRRRPDVVAAASAAVSAERPGFEILWAGGGAAEAGPGIRRLGWIADARVRALLCGAAFLLVPSILEGFGLPALEAMASSVPVIAARCDASVEVTGGHAALYDGGDAHGLAAAIKNVLDTPRPRARLALAKAHAGGFSWDACAKAHAHFLREVAEVGRERPVEW